MICHDVWKDEFIGLRWNEIRSRDNEWTKKYCGQGKKVYIKELTPTLKSSYDNLYINICVHIGEGETIKDITYKLCMTDSCLFRKYFKIGALHPEDISNAITSIRQIVKKQRRKVSV